MSALDKALRQIEQQRQIREGATSAQGFSPDFHLPPEPVRARPSRWMPVALGLLSLALVGTWLIMAGAVPAHWQSLFGGSSGNLPDARSAQPAAVPPNWPPSVGATPEAAPAAAPPGSGSVPVSAGATATAQGASASPPALPLPVPVPVPAPTVAGMGAGPVANLGANTAASTAASTAAITTAIAPTNPLPGSTAQAAGSEAARGGSAEMGQKFVYPSWHKAADRMWNWGLWDEAARVWLKGLKSEDPNAQMVLIGDQLTQLQATRQYAAWSPLLPVVALPRSGGNKKRWLLLAVPAAAELARARQLLLLAQGQAATVDSWAQWQKSLASAEVLGLDGSQVPPAQSPAMAVATQRSAASGTALAQGRAALPGTSAAPGTAAAPGASVASGAPAPSRARVLSAADAQAESADGASAGRDSPQLSRTESERLPAAGPVAPTAKAIDVDYQMIEKSLARSDHQAALDAAIKLEKYIGENWRTQYLAGVALMGLSRWEQAIAALGKAHELNPRHAMAALYLSVALQERGEHARAIQVLDKAQQLQPLSPELWLNQGHSLQALGHKAEARKAYNRFLELSVNRQDLAVQRVWVQNRLQKDNG